jgi:hypothetical protein
MRCSTRQEAKAGAQHKAAEMTAHPNVMYFSERPTHVGASRLAGACGSATLAICSRSRQSRDFRSPGWVTMSYVSAALPYRRLLSDARADHCTAWPSHSRALVHCSCRAMCGRWRDPVTATSRSGQDGGRHGERDCVKQRRRPSPPDWACGARRIRASSSLRRCGQQAESSRWFVVCRATVVSS